MRGMYTQNIRAGTAHGKEKVQTARAFAAATISTVARNRRELFELYVRWPERRWGFAAALRDVTVTCSFALLLVMRPSRVVTGCKSRFLRAGSSAGLRSTHPTDCALICCSRSRTSRRDTNTFPAKENSARRRSGRPTDCAPI